jgi:Cft2 family RNA processing exonuclease
MKLTPVSGLGAKGPACFLVEAGDARLLLDLGYGPQPGVWPDVSGVGRVDAVLLSHSHNDHAGGLELLGEVGHPRVFASGIVAGLIKDHDVAPLPLQGVTEVCGIRVTTGRNGHAPGGIWIHIDVGGGLLYMGDYSTESLLYAFDPPPRAATAIVDSSYGDYDVPMADCIRTFDPVFDAPPVLLPVPAAGRGPEVALHVLRSGRGLPHIDEGIRSGITNLLERAHASLHPGVEDDLERIRREAPAIHGAAGIMVAVSGDALYGEARRLVAEWEDADSPAIVFTGYRPPGSPSDRLTQSGRARALRWNVHPRVSDNARLVREIGAKTVLPAFGDARHLGAWQAAFAPARVVLDRSVAL